MLVHGIEYRNSDQGLPDYIDAFVEEQDTCLVLGKSPVIRTVDDHIPALVKKMEQQKPRTPGEVIVRHTDPKRFIAIIYDIDHKPLCRKEWIETALQNILLQCEISKIHTLAMPLLGMAYGRIDKKIIGDIIQSVLEDYRPACLGNIILIQE
jgi:hypothetical protein